MLLPAPNTIGLPAKYTDWRTHQDESVLFAVDSPKRFITQIAPTGSGKSLSYIANALLKGGRTVVLTSTKGLQSQLCVAPDTKVLTVDLRWVDAGSLSKGDMLLGFDKELNPNRRMWRPSEVLHTARTHLDCYKLTFEDGTTVTCSTDHKWLVSHARRGKAHGNAGRWVKTKDLRVCNKYTSRITKLFEVWCTGQDRDSGFLAAAFDGEGCLRQTDPARGNGVSVTLSFSQCANAMLDEVCRLLDNRGIVYSTHTHTRKNPKHRDNYLVNIRGRHRMMAFLGSMRPPRLLKKFNPNRLGMIGPIDSVALTKKEFVGKQEVVVLATATETYVANGLASHNCSDFESIGMVDVRGRNAYYCRMEQDGTKCDHAPCVIGYGKCGMKDHGGCDYYDHLKIAQYAKLVVTNYAYWMAIHEYGDGLGDFDIMVCDEAHNTPDVVSDFLTETFDLSDPFVRSLMPYSPSEMDIPDWALWAGKAADTVDLEMQKIKDIASEGRGLPRALRKTYARMLMIHKSLEAVTCVDKTWVVDVSPSRISFAPIWPTKYCEQALFKGIPKIILTSATVNAKTCDMLNIDPDDNDIREYPHPFPRENRLLMHIPTVRMNHNTTDLDMEKWVNRIDQILTSRQDRKGIIHTVSYKRRDYLLTHSRFVMNMVTHSSGNAEFIVNKFKNMSPPAVLVSPSVTTGYDFPDDLCRFQIIGKLAYPDTRSKIVQARTKLDDEYSPYAAAQQLVQAVGRSVRHESDHAENFIIDDNIEWFMTRYKHLMPKWFREAFVQVSTIPKPPSRLEEVL